MANFNPHAHDSALSDICAQLSSKGFEVLQSMAYHDVLSESDQQLLRQNQDATSLYARISPDIVVAHSKGTAFIDLKTSPNERCSVNAHSYLHWLIQVQLGVDYVYLVQRDDDLRVLVPGSIDPVRYIIPPCAKDQRKTLHKMAMMASVALPVAHDDYSRGSNQPFFVFSSNDLDQLPSFADWASKYQNITS